MFWLLLLIVCASCVYFLLIKPFSYWKENNVPCYSHLQSWMEMFTMFVRHRTFPDTLLKLYKDFEGHRYFGEYQLGKPLLYIRDANLIKQIAVKDFDHFVDHSLIVPDDSEGLFHKNLLFLKGDQWKSMRSALSPAFTGIKLKAMFHLMTKCANQFVTYFLDQNEDIIKLETKSAFAAFTNDVIASTVFGVECDTLRDKNNEFYENAKDANKFGGSFWANMKILLHLLVPDVAKALRVSLFDKKVGMFFRKVVAQNLREREEQNIIRMDMMHLLMTARKERAKNIENEQWSDDDITAQAMIFFLAGFDSVSTALSFLSFELATHPDVQKNLQDEIDSTLNKCHGELTYEALIKMKYMDAVVMEDLRKWSVGVGMDRMCVKPYTIQPANSNESPVHLKPGDVILILSYGLHMDEKYYTDPFGFHPERFLDENRALSSSYPYYPFGSGPRSCIGNRFALVEIKLVVFYLLSKFDIVLIEETELPLRLGTNRFHLAARNGMWLGFKPRMN